MAHINPERKRAVQRRWLSERRAKWLAENGPCRHCGSSENLEIHHVDPSKKVSHNVWSWSEERRNAELAKCIPLCNSCHKAENRKQSAQRAAPIIHGTRITYVRDRCRCDACRRANTRYAKEGRALNNIR